MNLALSIGFPPARLYWRVLHCIHNENAEGVYKLLEETNFNWRVRTNLSNSQRAGLYNNFEQTLYSTLEGWALWAEELWMGDEDEMVKQLKLEIGLTDFNSLNTRHQCNIDPEILRHAEAGTLDFEAYLTRSQGPFLEKLIVEIIKDGKDCGRFKHLYDGSLVGSYALEFNVLYTAWATIILDEAELAIFEARDPNIFTFDRR